MSALSIVYITLNAEQHIKESLLASLALGDEVLLVDSGSIDATLAIAEQLGVKIIHQPWLGYAKQKQLAIDSAQHDIVLFLDSDEILSEEALTEIHGLLRSDQAMAAAYSLPRENRFQGKWIRHGSWWPDRVVRLVDRRQGRIKPVLVHEGWETEAEVVALTGPIRHYSYQSYSELIQKADRYSSLAAQQLFEKGRRSQGWEPLTHAFAGFIRLFVLKLGFLDGVEGAAIAYTAALASFMKYAKLQELQRLRGKSEESCI